MKLFLCVALIAVVVPRSHVSGRFLEVPPAATAAGEPEVGAGAQHETTTPGPKVLKRISQAGWAVGTTTEDTPDPAGAAQAKFLQNQYLHLTDMTADCNDRIMVHSPVKSIPEAEEKCSNIPYCNFFVANPYDVTLCKSGYYTNPKKQKGSMVYVKASRAAGATVAEFSIFPNVQSLCERDQLVAEADSVHSIADAATACKRVNCDYFVLSTIHRVKGARKAFTNHAWLCKGKAIHIPHDGFVTGEVGVPFTPVNLLDGALAYPERT